MTPIATAIKHLLAAGVTGDALVTAVSEIEAAMLPQQEKPRSAAAARQAKYRERKAQSVTCDATRDDVTESDVCGVTSDAEKPSLARVRDNPSRLVISGNHTTLHCADAEAGAIDVDLGWPETDKPSRPYLDRLEVALRQAAGPALSAAPKLCVVSSILALGRRGTGPPCDLQADVLPTIMARAAKARPASIHDWSYFVPAIRETRDRRLQGAPATEIIPIGRAHERHHDSRSEGRSVWSEIAADEAAARAGSG